MRRLNAISRIEAFTSVIPTDKWRAADIAATFPRGAHRLGIPSDIAPLGPVWALPEAIEAVKKVVLLLPLLQRALRSVGTSRAELITALRADPRLYPVDEGRAEDPKMALMFARPDIAVSESGPKVMEFNTGA